MLVKTITLLTMASMTLYAQAPTASLSGTITDPSGGVLIGAAITVKNLETGVSRATTTNQAGNFQILGLQAGRYHLLASQPKFTTVQRKDLILRVGDELRINLTLPAAENRESIVVNESAPLVQLESAAAFTVVDQTSLQDLPTDGRQLQNLALTVPGVTAGWNVSTAANRYGKARENTEGAFSVNGTRSRSNNFVFDGMPMIVQQYSVINFEPSNEAVREFSVLSEVPSAAYGRTMGGQISIVTRGGSNQFHGAAYEFFRNNVLNANDTFSNRAGLPRGIVRHNQFGASLGGPIWKQKHFFFLNTELLRNQEGSETRTSFVPTADQARGIIPFINAAGAAQTLDLGSRITPISAKLLSLYPAPNASQPGGNYVASLAIALHDSQFHIRTDHHFTGRDLLTVRTSWNLNDQVYIIDRFGGPYIPGFPLPNPERTTNGTLGYLHTFSAAVSNEARIGVNRYGNILANGDQRNAAEFGLPNGAGANGIPTISFSAGGLAGLGGLSWYNRDQNETTIHASDSLSLLHGSHSLKFGGEATRYHFNTRGAGNQRGTIAFDGSRNTLIPKTPANALANTLADLLLGLPYQAGITIGQFGRGYRQSAFALFAQDTWRITRRLTLDYGLRFDYSAPWTEVNNKLSNFVPSFGLTTAQDPNWPGLYRPDRNNFAPRFGFAYDLTGKQRTIVRGGFGIVYETLLQASTVQQVENNPPYSASAVTNAPTPFATSSSGQTRTLLDLLASAQPSRSGAAVPLDLRNPYSMQFSLAVQHALTPGVLLEAAYRGTRGIHLQMNYNENQVNLDALSSTRRAQIAAASLTPAGTAAILDPLRPFPGFNSINLYTNSANSIYHSLQIKLERRFQSGLNLLAGCTWSKSIDSATDFGSGDASETVLNSYNLALQRGASSFDVPHRFTLALNYPIPAPAWKSVLGGWQVNAFLVEQSGQPFTPYTSQFDPYRNESFNRLMVVGDPHRNVPDGMAYNPAAFVLPTLGVFGNSGRNIIRGDGFHTADLSLFKNIAIRESLRLQLRFEATNSFNSVNYQGPVVNQSTNPGTFVATAVPRTVQLGAKLSF
ncbi:MAG: TonB-dependent receptor [Bryobacterales bacterium]|nr:TonB-dependent receptor [Bryobacterales bacterium]